MMDGDFIEHARLEPKHATNTFAASQDGGNTPSRRRDNMLPNCLQSASRHIQSPSPHARTFGRRGCIHRNTPRRPHLAKSTPLLRHTLGTLVSHSLP